MAIPNRNAHFCYGASISTAVSRLKHHAVEVVAQGAAQNAGIQAFVPKAGVLVEEDLVFRAAQTSLLIPTRQERGLIEKGSPGLNPRPKSGAAGLVHHAEAAELGDRLREDRDLR